MDIVSISSAFLLGLIARQFGMPPLVGYLIAGFILYASGIRLTETISNFAEMGVTMKSWIVVPWLNTKHYNRGGRRI